MSNRTRRRFLKATAAAGVSVTLAGCSFLPGGGNGDDTPDENTTTGNGTATNESTPQETPPGEEWADVTPIATRTTPQFAGDPQNLGWVANEPFTGSPEERWQVSVPEFESFNSNPSATGSMIYTVPTDGVLRGYDVETGDITVETPLGLRAGHTPTPIAGDEQITVNGEIDSADFETFLTQVTIESGERAWSSNFSAAPAGEFSGDDTSVVQGTTTGRVYAYNPAEKALEQWNATVGGSIIGAAAVGSDRVIVATDGTVTCLGKDDGSQQWEFGVSGTVVGSPVLYGEVVVVPHDDGITVIEAATGETVLESPDSVTASDGGVAVRDDWGIVPQTGGSVQAVNVFSGDSQWDVSLDAAVTGRPVIAGESVYLPTEAGVSAVSFQTGELQWVFETPAAVTGEVVIADGVLGVQTDETLHAVTGSE